MKKNMLIILNTFLLLSLASSGLAQSNQATSTKSDKKLTMTWTTKSKEARDLANSGVYHLMNVEFAEAYSDLTAALKLDPSFTIPLVFMTNLSRGETRKAYAARTAKSAENKTAGEQLFATLANETNTAEQRSEIWAKLHAMFPDGSMLAHFYVVTRATPEERFAAGEAYIKQFPESPAMYNTLAYYYMLNKKDNDMAKKYFEKYISLYPEGCNPYDSMGEFYLNTGDTANAEKYYKLALEKYPLNNSSLDALRKINDAKPKENTPQ